MWLYIKKRKQPQYNYTNGFDLNDFNFNMVQNRTVSESDDEEETFNTLDHEFGDVLKNILKPWSAVKMGEEIGSGSFGKVFHGTLDVGEFTRVEVAIKESSNFNNRTDLIHEGNYLFLNLKKKIKNVYFSQNYGQSQKK